MAHKVTNIFCHLWNSFLGALGFPVQRYICFRPYVLPVVVGLCLGITIHMMFVPFLEESCDVASIRKAASMTSSRINSQSTKASNKNGLPAGNDDFEARIVKPIPSNNTGIDKEAVKPKVVRPRYISSELGIREKLFVGVFTSAPSIDKLGVAVDKTMSKYVTKLIFFSSLKPTVVPSGLPMVAFGDKHSEMLPIHVLKYIKEHYPETFDFYLLISDRSYIRAEKYFDLVERISVRDYVYMGVPGVDKNICMLEGGILISQSVMQQVLSNIDWCTINLHPDNPSVTLGRCVHHASQKRCMTKGGDQALRYYQLQDFDYDGDIHRLKTDPAFNQSLTLFPMPDDISHYKLHRYFCYVDLNETRYEIMAAKKDIIELSEYSPGGTDSLTWPIGVPAPFKPPNRYSVIQWTYFTETHMYLPDELTGRKEITGVDKLDIADIKITAMENLDKKYHSQFVLKKILNGYRRFDPTRGMEYVLDLLLSDRHHQNTETIKRVHLIRPLGKVELVPMPYVTESMMITIILPLKPSEVGIFESFLEMYLRACVIAKEDVRLIVALLQQGKMKDKNRDPFARVKSVVMESSKKYDTKGKLTWKAIDGSLTDIMIIDELQNEFKTDALVLFTTVNAEFSVDLTSSYLNRVRMNTIKGKQVFFPMGFWQYKPNLIYNKKPFPSSVEIGQRLGHFSTDSYDHCSFYTSDFKTARKTLSPSFARSEDIFTMFISYKNFHVFRAVEPNLKLRWMNLTCDPHVATSQYQHCVTRNLEGLASQHHLALLVYEQRNEIITPPNLKNEMQKSVRNDAELLKLHQENINTLSDDPKTEEMLVLQQNKKK